LFFLFLFGLGLAGTILVICLSGKLPSEAVLVRKLTFYNLIGLIPLIFMAGGLMCVHKGLKGLKVPEENLP